MKVRCDRNELSERLQAINGIIPAGPTVKPILQNFLLRGSAQGLVVEATDLDISARVTVERAEVLEEGEMVLPAARFQPLVREMPGVSVLIDRQPGEPAATVRAEDFEFRLLSADAAEFPKIRELGGDGVLLVQREAFLESLRRVGVAACRDPSRYQLNGVFFEVEDEKLKLTATDGKRLTHDIVRIQNAGKLKLSAIVPNRGVDAVSKVLASGDDIVKLLFHETELQVAFGFGSVLVRLIEGTYPDYTVGIPKDPQTRVVCRRAELMAAVRSASLVTDKETATIEFHFSADEICLESRGRDVGESRIRVNAKTQGDPLQIRFSPTYLIDALRTVNEEEIRMELSGAGRPGAIRAGEHYRHFVMPLVLE